MYRVRKVVYLLSYQRIDWVGARNNDRARCDFAGQEFAHRHLDGESTFEVSADGKTLTATLKGADASGADFEQIIVCDRE